MGDPQRHDTLPARPSAYRYWAFISYSHADEKWGRWLHKKIEGYRVPRALIGRPGPFGPVPRRPFPVFRDREEFATSADLTDAIAAAIEASRCLIVICSPKAAVSRWVDEEIRRFRELGRGDRILCLLVHGEPHASDQAQGGQLEAFPESLRFEQGPDGKRTRLETEPLAADVRPGKDTKINARLKLLAGILGVDFDELRQRDKRRRFWRRAQVSGLALVIAAVIVGVWWNRQQVANFQRQIALAGDLATQAEMLRAERPDRLNASIRLGIESMQRSLDLQQPIESAHVTVRRGSALTAGRPETERQHPASVSMAAFDPTGRWLASVSDSTVWIGHSGGDRPAVPLAHDGAIERILFAADGRLATLVASTVRVWDVASGRTLVESAHPSEVLDLAFDAEGQRLTTVARDGVVRLLEIADGAQRTLMTHDDQDWPVSLSADGRRLATKTDATTVRVWSVQTAALQASITAVSPVLHMAFDRDGRRLVTASAFQTLSGAGDSFTQTWDLDAGRQLARMPHETFVSSAEFLPSGEWLVTRSQDDVVRVWDATTGQPRLVEPAARAQLSLDGPWLVTAAGNVARVWAVRSGREVARAVHQHEVAAVTLSPDGLRFATADGATLRTWRLPTRRQFEEMLPSDPFPSALVFSASGATLATASEEGTVSIWDVAQMREQASFDAGPQVRIVGVSADGRRLATQSGLTRGASRFVSIWEMNGEPRPVRIEAEPVLALAMSGNGSRVVTSSSDGAIVVWNAATGEQLATRRASNPAEAVALSVDGALLATAESHAGVQLADAVTSSAVSATFDHPGGARQLSFDAASRYLTSVGGTSVRVWDVSAKRMTADLSHDADVVAVTWDRDGSRLATATAKGRVAQWSTEAGKRLWQVEVQDAVGAMTYSPDGNWLAVSSSGAVRLVESSSGRLFGRLLQSADLVSLSPDGRWLASGSPGAGLELWSWPPEILIREACARLRHDLAATEWVQYLGTEQPRPCPGFGGPPTDVRQPAAARVR